MFKNRQKLYNPNTDTYKDVSGYKIKTIPFKVKDVHDTKRIVVAQISSFDTLDSDSDIIRPGAFNKSIQEKGPLSMGARKIKHLRDHEWTKPVGKILELRETADGLEMTSVMGTSTVADDTLRDYKEGILTEHSIGFRYMADKIEYIEDSKLAGGGFYNITELDLWEGSAVLFGANEFTPVIEVGKSFNKVDVMFKYMTELDDIAEKMRKGNTDEDIYTLEMRLRVIKEKINSLVNYEPEFDKESLKGKSTHENKPKEPLVSSAAQYYLKKYRF